MVLRCLFLVPGFRLLFLVRAELLSGHLLGNSSSFGRPYDLFVFRLFVILVISRFGLNLRAGFGFLLLQFLIFAYFLLLLWKSCLLLSVARKDCAF